MKLTEISSSISQVTSASRPYSIDRCGADGGGVTVEFTGAPDLVKDGIAPGDWFVISGIRPGLKVNVASEWRLNDIAKTPNSKGNLK